MRSNTYSFLTFLLLVFTSSVVALAERLPIKTFTVADNLAHNEINKIVRDSRGFLWFCTADGLSRFDGYGFTNYSTNEGLPHPYVNDVLETRTGEYWLATNGGLVRFDPRGIPGKDVVYANDSLSNAPPMFSVVVPDDTDRRARAVTVLFASRDGSIWCGTMKGLFRLERTNNRFTLRPIEIGIPKEFPDQAFISDVLDDHNGSLWISTPSGLYRRWPDGTFAHYTLHDGLPDQFIHDLFIDHEGQLWAGSRGNGFFSLASDETHKAPVVTRSFTMKEGLPANWIFQLFETSNHRFWIATSAGVAEFFPAGDGRGHYFHNYSEANGLSHHDINALNEDLAGNLWLGSPAGVMKLARNGFTTYDRQDGVDEVDSVFGDRNGGVGVRGWVLGDGRISVFEGAKLNALQTNLGEHVPRFGRFDGEGFTWLLPDELSNPKLGWVGESLTLQTRNGEWWLGTGAGLYRFPALDDLTQLKSTRPLLVYTKKDGLANQQVYRVFEDSRQDIWVSTIGPLTSLARWDRASGVFQDLSNMPGLPPPKEDVAHAFADDRAGNVWVGFGTGLARYHEGSFKFFTTNDGLPKGGISQIYLDHAGRLWLASSRSGLIPVDNYASDRPAFVSYTTAQGLSSDITSVITEDHQGHLYVGTGRGLDQLDPVSGRIKHFTTADGLISGLMLSAFCDSSGRLWFGTQKGLSRFDPAAEETTAPPAVLIAKLSVSGAEQRVSALGETEMMLHDFPADQNQFQIDFVGLSFAPGEVMRYQYKLEGTNSDWTLPTEQRTVNFASLAPGKYRFLVRAINSDGAVSLNPAAVSFRILTPLWRRWWVLTIAFLTIVSVVFTVIRYRMARLLEITNMRTRIATDLHDDIGANLTRIALLSEVAKQQLDNVREPVVVSKQGVPENGREDSPLVSIARIARESAGSMGDIVWAINPERDSLLDLTRKMRQHADEVFTLRDIELRFNAPNAKDSLRLGTDIRRDLLLIFKEAVNNAARHSRCSSVRIDFRVEGPMLILEIADNGIGVDPDIETQGQGLRSMMRRATVLRGTIKITSQSGEQTIVSVKVPVSQRR